MLRSMTGRLQPKAASRLSAREAALCGADATGGGGGCHGARLCQPDRGSPLSRDRQRRRHRRPSGPDVRVALTTSPVDVPDIAVLTGEDGGFSITVPAEGAYGVAAISDEVRTETTVEVRRARRARSA